MLGTADEELTVDELAARAGVTVRTVRFYASRGLLPPPRLRGRLGLYGTDHLGRLELIRELQTLGFTLSAIERHLERIPDDASAEDLALHRALLAPWTTEHSEDLTRHEIDQRVGRHLDDDVIEQLVSLGILHRIEADNERLRLPSPAMLSIGVQVVDLGVPKDMLQEADSIVRSHTQQIAVELQDLFSRKVLRPYLDSDRNEEERDRVRALADQLRPLTIQVLVHGFQHAVNDVIRDRV